MVCISDTHNNQVPNIPDGDILIHAGDVTQRGTLKEMQTSLDWLTSLPHPHKLLIAGNHDILLDPADPHADPAARSALDWGDVKYLNDEATIIKCSNDREIKVYGSPHTPRHGNWAFQYPRDRDVWQGRVPVDTDVLVTHGPPKGHLDAGHFGCAHLLGEIWKVRPRLHVFGHIHDGHGVETLRFDYLQKAYEQTVATGGGLWNLGQVVFQFMLAYFNYSSNLGARTVLVNAAVSGGVRDDLRRRPVVVHV